MKINTLLIFSLLVFVNGCMTPENPRTPIGYNDFKDLRGIPISEAKDKAKEMAEENFRKGRFGYFTRLNLLMASDTEELPREEYLRTQYGIQTIIIKHCLTEHSILHAQYAYNKTMDGLIKKKFGKGIKDIISEGIKYEHEFYRKAPLKDDFGLYLSALITRLVPENVKTFKVELSPDDFWQLKKKPGNIWRVTSFPENRYLFDYHVKIQKLIFMTEMPMEHFIGGHYFLSEKIRTQIKNGQKIEITGAKSSQKVPVKVKLNKSSIIFTSGKKTPIKVFWDN